MQSGKSFLAILLILLPAGGCCCSPQNGQKSTHGSDIAKSVFSGFEPSPSRLYVAKDRLYKLISRLGYDADKYSYSCDHSSDGTSLRCWNQHRSKAIVFVKGKTPMIVETPQWSYLDDDNKPVAWYREDASDYRITFRNGKELTAPDFHMDASGRFFCYGGRYYDYAAKVQRDIPIYIAAIDEPEKPLVTSQILGGLLEGIYVSKNAVYIMARVWPKEKMCNDLVCEEYTIKGCDLVFERQFNLRCPAGATTVNFVPEDFDSTSCSFLLSASREVPIALILGPKTWYVYEVETGQFREVGVFEGYAGFLDRNLFDRTLEGLAGEASRRK